MVTDTTRTVATAMRNFGLTSFAVLLLGADVHAGWEVTENGWGLMKAEGYVRRIVRDAPPYPSALVMCFEPRRRDDRDVVLQNCDADENGLHHLVVHPEAVADLLPVLNRAREKERRVIVHVDDSLRMQAANPDNGRCALVRIVFQ